MLRSVVDHIGRRSIAWTIIILFGLALVARVWDLLSISATGGFATVVLLYDPIEAAQHPEVRAAYDQFFAENGIPRRWISFDNAILMPWDSLERDVRAVVFPDRIAQRARDGFGFLLADYVRRGGNVLVVQDAGAQERDGYYRNIGAFDPLLGIHYIHADQKRARSFRLGEVRFVSPAQADRWKMPAGKVDREGFLVGYGYGRLRYPINIADTYDPSVDVDAVADGSPILAQRQIGRGLATYINLPLGDLKASGDSLPMQAIMTSVLYGGAQMPHLVAAPDGIGRIIINIHIDSNAEWLGIPNLRARGILRKDVRMEFDVTAGPDMLHPGDGQGFHACDPLGIGFLRTLAQYGTIGDHGGWAHNFFAFGVEGNRFSPAEIKGYIARNSLCLESVLHRPIRSYAAPDGAHPQPMTTDILESLGIDSYYYTGDSGSPALRPFYNGRIVGTKSWAFPVMSLGTAASVQEMWQERIKPERMRQWLDSTLQFAEHQRSIYLVYTHSYDLRVHPEYAPSYGAFLDQVERDQRDGTVYPTTMPEATAFLQRYVQTSLSYRQTQSGLIIDLDNPEGLRDIAFAVPEGAGEPVRNGDIVPSGSDDGYHIYYVRTNQTHVSFAMAAPRPIVFDRMKAGSKRL